MSLIDFFDRMRYWKEPRRFWLSKIYFYRGMNFLSQVLANLVLPLYFTATRKHYVLKHDDEKKQRIIVSMTSFPVRLGKVHMAIESIFRQSVLPDKIILYLTKSQVGDIEGLPQALLSMRQRGLEIKLCQEPIRSHTKYYMAFRDYPDDIVITVDDDVIYRSDLIETLLKFHNVYPNSIIVNWAKKIVSDSTGKSYYNQWPETVEEDIGKEAPKYLLFGVGGVLYPPRCMYEDCLNCDMIQKLSLTADDVWLSAMAILKGTTFVYTGYIQHHLPIVIKNNETLISANYVRNQICVESINTYYWKKKTVAPLT